MAFEPYAEPVAGAPEWAIVELGAFKGVDVGVWECTPGSFADVEEDEVFVVLSGSATIDFVDPELPSVDVGPGDIVELTAGMSTVWHVHQTIRKVYLA